MQSRFTSFVLAGALGALVLSATPSVSFADPVNGHSIHDRFQHQRYRIHEGVEQDQITRGERNRLLKEQARIHQARYRLRHNDGQLEPRERARLQHRLNQSSRHIYQARHN